MTFIKLYNDASWPLCSSFCYFDRSRTEYWGKHFEDSKLAKIEIWILHKFDKYEIFHTKGFAKMKIWLILVNNILSNQNFGPLKLAKLISVRKKSERNGCSTETGDI